MLLGLDISTSITGATVVDLEGNIVFCESWDFRNKRYFPSLFEKGQEVKSLLEALAEEFPINLVYIEQSLQSFRSGYSSAKTLSTLSRFNGIVSWLCYEIFKSQPEYVAATTARKLCGIKIPKGQRAKEFVLQYLLTNEEQFDISYTRNGNPRPDSYDKADSIVVARAGLKLWKNEKGLRS